ncbi:leucine-rich repeat domain-containing protein [uncultured Microbacterium sp.]|uniref:leucine-rich repeat domain-containing protein n=1 Tax=uncultured Microbacterium sp. TaxID=191216 RepID=UPI0025E6D91A|nr:leucine-rich repeat domain-containing protein [uncultured Microbacterium sp.]
MADGLEALDDVGLRAAVREQLRQMRHGADAGSVTELVVDEASTLDGIEQFPHIRQLGLEGTDVVDLRPLAGLRDLRELWLNDTRVADLGPLSALRALTILELGDTPVADIAPLRSLGHLQKLWLNGTSVTDLDPIRSLKALVTVGVAGTPIEDYSPFEALEGLQTLIVSRSASGRLGSLSSRTNLCIHFLDG